MKMKKTKFALVVSLFASVCVATASSSMNIRYFVVTAPTSANNNSSIQNVMSFVDKGGVTGLIPLNREVNPAALYRPHILEVSDIIYSPASLKLWDVVGEPDGVFSNENGSRLAWSLDYKNTTPFLVSDVYFRLWSSDAANTIRFSGNIATNGTAPLTFSPTLRGELWDESGNKVAVYYNGETVADHPVNRVIALIRLGYYVTDMSQVQLDLDYFRNEMTITNFAAFYTASGLGETNCVCSRPFLTPNRANNNGDELVTLEGQRRIGMTYSLEQTPSF